jgi:hypothetical protein
MWTCFVAIVVMMDICLASSLRRVDNGVYEGNGSSIEELMTSNEIAFVVHCTAFSCFPIHIFL